MMANVIMSIALCGFHNGISMLALYRASVALRRASREGRADTRTMWRLSLLRFCLVPAALSGGIVGFVLPLVMLNDIWRILPLLGDEWGTMIFFVSSWLIWVVSTVALDNLSRRWLAAC